MKYKKFIVPIILILLFLFLRFYNIKDSLFFFNDMGRDLWVLQNWQLSGKPPLLGPQTSVLPFNQSSIYFYYLYIFYFITKGSVFSALFANAFLYVAMYIFGLYIFKKDQKFTNLLNITFFLISIHPQYIIQSRFVWNPSLVTPFIVSSVISFYLLIQKYSPKKLWFFSLSLAAAISISYSVIPLFVGLLVYWLIFVRKYFVKLSFSMLVSFLLLNITTIFFEIRHKFLLTNSLLTKPSSPQLSISVSQKFHDLSQFVINLPNQNWNQYILFLFIILSAVFCLKNFKKKDISLFLNTIFLFTFLSYFIIPVSIQAHYVFPVISLLFLSIASGPIYRSFIIIAMLTWVYLSPLNLVPYFSPSRRTYNQMDKCFTKVCQEIKEPIFVSVQSNFQPYHHGPEHRYLLKKNGCNVVNIEENNQLSDKMALVVDGGDYDPQRTKFYELELLGQSKIIKTFECQINFKVHILQKDNVKK
jgi:hypothetical protein